MRVTSLHLANVGVPSCLHLRAHCAPAAAAAAPLAKQIFNPPKSAAACRQLRFAGAKRGQRGGLPSEGAHQRDGSRPFRRASWHPTNAPDRARFQWKKFNFHTRPRPLRRRGLAARPPARLLVTRIDLVAPLVAGRPKGRAVGASRLSRS